MKKENFVSVPFMVLGIVFCVCLVAANLLETKVVQLGPISVTCRQHLSGKARMALILYLEWHPVSL